MEARSLASLNYLAANPPQYPENPAEEKHEPLTLYISRVPGTRDVILSPFKPQLKNVTGDDVANALYYVHLVSRSASVGPPPAAEDDMRGSDDESHPSGVIHRKPLPASDHSPTADGLPNGQIAQLPPITGHSQKLAGHHNIPVSSLDRKPLPVPSRPLENSRPGAGDVSSNFPLQSDPAPPELPPRKPLGPRPMIGVPNGGRDKMLPSVPDASIRNPTDYVAEPGMILGERRVTRSPSPKKLSGASSPVPFALALIRRDPGTANQWNVGTISSQQSIVLSSQLDSREQLRPPSPPALTSRPPIDIEIETSGYAKFRAIPRLPDSDPAAALSALAGTIPDVSSLPIGGSNMFSRQVTMAYSKSWSSNLREKFHRVEQSAKSMRGRARAESTASVEAVNTSAENGELPGQGMRPRGYVFTSPWDGQCEFRTGNGGRTVRCHHALHEGKASAYNPLVADHGSDALKIPSNVVSELRFNLPSSELFGSFDQGKDPRVLRQGHFSKLLQLGSRDDSSEDDGLVSPFDMELGKEKAGGGNRGTRAKLGKLIVSNDGLKMLDLVVAANIGVWWEAWDRSFSE